MKKYRLTKYNPIYRNKYGEYEREEWTSIYDVGKMYKNQKFSLKEYNAMEKKYEDSIMALLRTFNVERMCVKKLENYFSLIEIERMLAEVGCILTEKERKIISSLRNNKIINFIDIGEYIRLILRECFWCELEGVSTGNNVKISFGYDYYTYIQCKEINQDIIVSLQRIGIYVEEIT